MARTTSGRTTSARGGRKATSATPPRKRAPAGAGRAGQRVGAAAAGTTAPPTTAPPITARPTAGAAGASDGSGAAQPGREAGRQATSTLRQQVDARTSQAGDQLAQTAGDVRQIGAQLREQDNDGAARLADMAAERLESFAGYLSGADPDRIIDDVEDFARSRPWLAAGAGLAAGFAVTRALSASRRKRYGGGYVDTSAGSEFSEEDAEAAYDDGGDGR
jgi:hypothetical protein